MTVWRTVCVAAKPLVQYIHMYVQTLLHSVLFNACGVAAPPKNYANYFVSCLAFLEIFFNFSQTVFFTMLTIMIRFFFYELFFVLSHKWLGVSWAKFKILCPQFLKTHIKKKIETKKYLKLKFKRNIFK